MSGFGPPSSSGLPTVKKAGVAIGSQQGLNFIEGANVTLTIANDAGNGEVDITIAAAGGGGSSGFDMLDEGVSQGIVTSADFTGSMVAASAVGALGTIAIAHGAQAGGTTHADVVAGGAAGFMTGADKTKLDGIATGATAGITTQDEGAGAGVNQTTLNFVGAGVTASSVGAVTTVTIPSTGVSDGDKGDIVVSSSGTVWSLDSGVVTAAARTVLDDATVGDMVNTLGGATSTGTGGLVRAAAPTLTGAAAGDRLTLTSTSGTALNATSSNTAPSIIGTAANIFASVGVRGTASAASFDATGVEGLGGVGGHGGSFTGGNNGGAGVLATGGLRTGPGVATVGGLGDAVSPGGGVGGTFTGGAGYGPSNGNGGVGGNFVGGTPATGSGVAGIGITATGGAKGAVGIKGTGTVGAAGVWGVGGATNGNGGLFEATGTGIGLVATNTASGYALQINQDLTSPVRAAINWPAGDALPTGAHVVGDIANVAGVIYSCTVAGTPGTWTRIGDQLTTNANLTGPITSVGNATTIADPELAAIAGLTSAADSVPYFTGSGTAALATVTSAARTVLDDTTVGAMVDTLGGASSTGTGGIARAISPVFTTPNIGSATGSISGNAATVTTNANLTGVVTSVGNATSIANGAIALAKLANGTDGEIPTWDSSGVITTVAVGTSGHVLTSNGAGAAPTFQAPSGGAGLVDADYGDITVSGTGTVMTIDNDVVTYAKMQNVSATDRLLGRDTAAAGDVEELSVGGGIEFTGSGGIQRSALTGDVTASAGSGSTTIATAAVTLAKMANLAQDQFIVRTTASTGVPETATVTAAARTILDDTTVGAILTTIGGLGGTLTATDNIMMRTDGTGTKTAQGSGVTLDDANGIAGHTEVQNVQTGTTYTMAAGDSGKVVIFTNAAAVTVTVPQTLTAGWHCRWEQHGAGKVSFNGTAVTAATLRNRSSQVASAGLYAVGGLACYTTGTPAVVTLFGDTGA